jgi:hypothetical protein
MSSPTDYTCEEARCLQAAFSGLPAELLASLPSHFRASLSAACERLEELLEVEQEQDSLKAALVGISARLAEFSVMERRLRESQEEAAASQATAADLRARLTAAAEASEVMETDRYAESMRCREEYAALREERDALAKECKEYREAMEGVVKGAPGGAASTAEAVRGQLGLLEQAVQTRDKACTERDALKAEVGRLSATLAARKAEQSKGCCAIA